MLRCLKALSTRCHRKYEVIGGSPDPTPSLKQLVNDVGVTFKRIKASPFTFMLSGAAAKLDIVEIAMRRADFVDPTPLYVHYTLDSIQTAAIENTTTRPFHALQKTQNGAILFTYNADEEESITPRRFDLRGETWFDAEGGQLPEPNYGSFVSLRTALVKTHGQMHFLGRSPVKLTVTTREELVPTGSQYNFMTGMLSLLPQVAATRGKQVGSILGSRSTVQSIPSLKLRAASTKCGVRSVPC